MFPKIVFACFFISFFIFSEASQTQKQEIYNSELNFGEYFQGADAENKKSELFIFAESTYDEETESILLSIKRLDTTEFCGVFLTVGFESEFLSLASVTAGELCQNFSISYLCNEGEVRLLLDNSQNCGGESNTVASLRFEVKSDFAGELSFNLIAGEDSAFCLRDGRLCKLSLKTADTAISVYKNKSEPRIVKITKRRGEIYLYGEIRGKIGFMAGFEVGIVNLSDGTVQKLITVKAVPIKSQSEQKYRFKQRVKIPENDIYCVIVRAITYHRDRQSKSERVIYYSEE